MTRGREAEGLLSGVLSDADVGLVTADARPHPQRPDRWQPVARWRDAATGGDCFVALDGGYATEGGAIKAADRIIDRAENLAAAG